MAISQAYANHMRNGQLDFILPTGVEFEWSKPGCLDFGAPVYDSGDNIVTVTGAKTDTESFITAYAKDDGAEVWSELLPAGLTGHAVILGANDTGVLAAKFSPGEPQGLMACLAHADGALAWESEDTMYVIDPFQGAALIGPDGTAYVPTDPSHIGSEVGMLAVDGTDGTTIWTSEDFQYSPTGACMNDTGAYIFVGVRLAGDPNNKAHLAILDASDGTTLWVAPEAYPIPAVPCCSYDPVNKIVTVVLHTGVSGGALNGTVEFWGFEDGVPQLHLYHRIQDNLGACFTLGIQRAALTGYQSKLIMNSYDVPIRLYEIKTAGNYELIYTGAPHNSVTAYDILTSSVGKTSDRIVTLRGSGYPWGLAEVRYTGTGRGWWIPLGDASYTRPLITSDGSVYVNSGNATVKYAVASEGTQPIKHPYEVSD